ncbi:MAG: T9SS type A sorting domain-containing protein [Calditrichaceae bacterium]|nr:T9SS type A sorting domain-containing protein [Calditrichaceae bacterium]MBN2709780.1 T9SS type A sorting domain-containing protein [Calditrichaceae bacterium]RQV94974.1 MAG: T9SS C-terminal target domain-containing protein [Calditrichota bacterium]
MGKHFRYFTIFIILIIVESHATDYLTNAISWKNCCQAYNQGYPAEDFQTNFVGDFNGDGLEDKLYMCSGKYWVAYTENKSTYGVQGFSGESWTKEIVFDSNSEFERRAIGDFNGDGADDILIIRAYSNNIKLEVALSVQKRLANSAGPYGQYIDVSDGSYFFKPNEVWGTTITAFKSAFENSFVKDAKLNKVYIGDVTGDGLDDIVILYYNKYIYVIKSVYTPNFSTSGADFANYSFSSHQYKLNLGSYVDEFFLGDFNGDGYDDITYTKISPYNNNFYIALNKGKDSDTSPGYFSTNEFTGAFYSPYDASGNHGSLSISNFPLHFISDFNGDGLDDKLYLCSSKYYISLSKISPDGKPYFQSEIIWGAIDWSNYGRSYIGDFNGDGFNDILNARTNSTWDVRLADKEAIFDNATFAQDGHNGEARMEKIVACWMFPFTYLWPERGWSAFGYHPNERYMSGFPYITPIINWGSTDFPLIETNSATWIEGPYSYLDFTNNPLSYSTEDVLKMQIESIIKSGIKVIVVDVTNGFIDVDEFNHQAYDSSGDSTNYSNVREALTNIFEIVKNNNLDIKIAVGLGKEFWGRFELKPHSYDPFIPCYGNANLVIGWEAQRSRQRIALDKIELDYITPYNDKYFYYQGKPLVVTYVIPSRDFPMTADGYLQETIPRTFFPDFNVKIALSANSTYAWFRGNNAIFQNGLDNTNYWSWGSELLNNNIYGADSKTANFPSYSNEKLPYNAECMSVMPGRTMVWHNLTDRDGNGVPRWADNNSNHYFESWKSVINADPRIVLICDWNTWGEATSIEACTTGPGKTWYESDGCTPDPGYDDAQDIQLFRSPWHNSSGTNDPFFYQNLTKDFSDYFVGNTYTPPVLSKANFNENLIIENPISFELKQNYPNPFNPITKIEFSIPEDSDIYLKIYNVLGQEVYFYHKDNLLKGYHTINFDGSNLSSGLYIYTFKAGKFEKKMKMLLVK